MILPIKRLVVGAVGLSMLATLAGCHSQPKVMTQEDFAANRKAGASPSEQGRK